MIYVAGMCALGVTSLVALALLCRYPRLWLMSLGVLATAASIVLYLPVRAVFHAPSGLGDGFGIIAESLLFASLVGPVHLGLFLILVGLVMEEAKQRVRDTKTHDKAITEGNPKMPNP